MKPMQKRNEGLDLGTAERRQPSLLDLMVLLECLDGCSTPATGQADRNNPPILRASFTHNPTIALERVENSRYTRA